MRKALFLSLVLLATTLAGTSTAGELADVTLDERSSAGDQELVLNGMGLRKKAFIKVYVAGLYLPAKQTDTAQILGADTPRKLIMQFVRGVGKGSLCGGWEDGLENNTPQAPAEVVEQFGQLCEWMDDVEDGDQLVFTYVPDQGTEVEVKGMSKGSVPGKAFADALFACWIGPSPPSEDFKEGLLGH